MPITGLILYFVIRTVLLGLLLWLLARLQKFNYSVSGLFGSAALACALDFLPFVGHAFAVLALYACLRKITRASFVPDLTFTVAVAYALMFGVRVLLFTCLAPPLHLTADFTEGAAHRPRLAMADPVPDFVASAPATNPAAAPPLKSADDWVQALTVKGATENGKKSFLLIRANQKIYTLVMDETIEVRTADGARRVRLVNVGETWATVEINGETAYLRIH
jgi:hypothetical protein